MADHILSEEVMWVLDNASFTFDMLRDPDWRPSREDYRRMRDAARVENERLREAGKELDGVISRLSDENERLREALLDSIP